MHLRKIVLFLYIINHHCGLISLCDHHHGGFIGVRGIPGEVSGIIQCYNESPTGKII
jgi:hypothetical protein